MSDMGCNTCLLRSTPTGYSVAFARTFVFQNDQLVAIETRYLFSNWTNTFYSLCYIFALHVKREEIVLSAIFVKKNFFSDIKIRMKENIYRENIVKLRRVI